MDRSFLKHAATYGLATFLVQAAGFVLLPVYLRVLSPAEYGVLEVVGRLAETAATLLLLGGFRQALFTFYQQAKDEAERRKVVTAAYLLVTVAGAVGAAATAAFAPWLSGGDYPTWLLHLAVWPLLLEPFSLLPLSLIQARVESGSYVVVVVSQFLLRVAMCIVLVRWLRWGVAGALVASLATAVLWGLLLSARELRHGVTWPGLARMKAMAAFALPLLPAGACYFVLHHSDRFFLLGYASNSEIGTYSLGYKVAMIARLLSLVPLYMVWSSRMYAVADQPDAPEVFGRVFTRVTAAYLIAGLGLSLFAPEIVVVLGGEDYADAAMAVAPIAFACGLQAASTLMDAAFFLRRRTGLKLAVTAAAAAVTLALYAVLIPSFGVAGAVAATVGGFASLAIGTYWATQRIFYVQYEWGRLAALLALSAALLALGLRFPSVTVKAALLAVAPVLAWHGNLVSDDEKRQSRVLARRLWPRPEGSAA